MKRQDRKRSSALRGANVLLLTLAVGLTACGDDDEGTDPTAGDEQSNPGDGNDDDGDGGEDDDPDPGDGDALNARIGNLTVGLDVTALDACVQTASDAPWQGPVLQAAGLEAVAAGELSEPLALELSETGRIRWVSGESDDCDTALAPSAEGDLAIESHREHSLLLFGAGDDLRRASFDNVVPETMDDGRFYARFFHAALGTELNLRATQRFDPDSELNPCGNPVSAFENVAFGTLGESGNNNSATFFSASVTAGQTAFETSIVLCAGPVDDTIEPLAETGRFTFNGGVRSTFYMSGDGSESAPYTFTVCSSDRPEARCTALVNTEN